MPVNTTRKTYILKVPVVLHKRLERIKRKRGWTMALVLRTAAEEYAAREEKADG